MTLLRKRVLTAFGAVVTVLAVFAFVRTFLVTVSAGEVSQFLSHQWGHLLVAIAIYLGAYIPMALGWVLFARAASIAALPRQLIRIFLISQIGKYLPGNVGHLLGRIYLSSRAGIPGTRAGLALGLELAATALSCALLVAGLFVFDRLTGGALGLRLPLEVAPSWDDMLLPGLLVLLLAAVAVLVGRNGGSARGWLVLFLSGTLMISVALVLAALGVLLILTGLEPPMDGAAHLTVVAAFLISWLAGFVTPGSPAGIGVREFVFLTLLQETHAPETLALTIAAFRVVTLTGDLVAWCVGLTFREPDPA